MSALTAFKHVDAGQQTRGEDEERHQDRLCPRVGLGLHGASCLANGPLLE